MIKVAAIETGKVTIKTAQAAAKKGRSALARKLDMLRDPNYTEPLPILCYLVQHPEGNFMVDTGDTYRNSTRGYLPWWNPFYKTQAMVQTGRHEEVGDGLLKLGIDPANDIDTVLMTHMHHDHAGGMHNFPRSKFIIPAENWKVGKSLMGMLTGYMPYHWPFWLRPQLIEAQGPAVGPFDRSYPVTKDGRIVMLPTPGHCPGHMSVIVRDTDVTYFITGDATYDERYLREGLTDGVSMHPAQSEDTIRRIHEFALAEPTVILPAHDPKAVERLQLKQLYTA